MADDKLTIHAFQEHIRDRYFDTDHARGSAATFVWFVEEVGELATALNTVARDSATDADRDNLSEEFADVVAWLCTLANINGVDLEQAIRAKYLEGEGPEGHK